MIRVHFTAADLLDTAFVSAPEPVLETVLAIAQLQRRDGDTAMTHWRRQHRASLPRPVMALLELIPPSGHGPLFLDVPSGDLEYGLDLMHATPRSEVVAELQRATGNARPSSFVRAVAARDAEAWRTMAGAIRASHHAMIEPLWERLCGAKAADIAHRGTVVARDGLQKTLAGLYPGSRWHGTTWEIDRPAHLDVKLDGRGLRLTPSPIWSGEALVNWDSDGHTVLIYPALHAVADLTQPITDDPLAALLGRTRARLLRELSGEQTTSELAARLEVSPATVSEHTKALRGAGLIETDRAGKTARHSCTPLGHQLAAGRTFVPEQRRPGRPTAV